jgi:hypothetical protein
MDTDITLMTMRHHFHGISVYSLRRKRIMLNG